MKNKKILILAIILFITIMIVILIFFKNNTAKSFKIGNNTSSQEIVDYILNIKSYETIVDVETRSNKNENKYVIKQSYNGEDENSQEILEPSNIEGVKMVRSGKTLKLENTNLKLTSIFENYDYLSQNCLDLSSFIDEYKNDANSKWEEKNGEIIMKTNLSKNMKKELYISKENGKPLKMNIEDTNKKTAIYILYREVNVNS
ncbi:MAG: hypothetical protein V8R81_00855 [Clostridia bacterium]